MDPDNTPETEPRAEYPAHWLTPKPPEDRPTPEAEHPTAYPADWAPTRQEH
jgi:hypothetical protein